MQVMQLCAFGIATHSGGAPTLWRPGETCPFGAAADAMGRGFGPLQSYEARARGKAGMKGAKPAEFGRADDRRSGAAASPASRQGLMRDGWPGVPWPLAIRPACLVRATWQGSEAWKAAVANGLATLEEGGKPSRRRSRGWRRATPRRGGPWRTPVGLGGLWRPVMGHLTRERRASGRTAAGRHRFRCEAEGLAQSPPQAPAEPPAELPAELPAVGTTAPQCPFSARPRPRPARCGSARPWPGGRPRPVRPAALP